MSKKILAPVFTDNMVLQRGKKIKLWGTAAPDSQISVTLGVVSAEAVSDNDGSWSLELAPMQAEDGLTLTASDGESRVTLSNIAVGEVWLAGGQSNMAFELSRCTDWERISSAPCSKVRFFYTPKHDFEDEAYFEAWENAEWQLTDSEEFGTWSAVGYIFAQRLANALGVTVGVIGCNWGGTSASVWMSREALSSDEDIRIYIDEFDEFNRGVPLEQQKKEYLEYAAYHSEWDAKCAELYEKNPATEWSEALKICGECRWPGPINSFNPFRPCGQYAQMIQKICPYTLRGFIYYQGENDDFRPRIYQKLLTALIELWRRDWQDDGLEFIITQLPMHRYEADPDFKNWPLIREAQLNVFKALPHTGIAVIPDCGQFNEIHPTNKTPVGERLALQALYGAYGLIDKSEAFGPIYSRKEIRGNALEVFFENADSGLTLKGKPECFEIAGSDKVFYPADISLNGSSVQFSSDKVSSPAYARYCWSNYCTPTLYGANGLPASPFRTDADDESNLETGAAKIQQKLEL
ncbi:MAG: sialate O-acetylesterase [Butyrivibrio sp.]|nr:sialate O-acetylesterase [Butyrivibrio sp.]